MAGIWETITNSAEARVEAWAELGKSRRRYIGQSWKERKKERKTQRFFPLTVFLVHKLVLNFRDGDVHDKKMS